MKTFYDHQEDARGNSACLMAMLTVAISITTVVTGLMVALWIFVPTYYIFVRAFPRPQTAFTLRLAADDLHPIQMWLVQSFPWMQEFPWELFAYFCVLTTIGTGTALLLVTRSMLQRLRQAGGVGLAESIGGICISKSDYRRDERTQQAVNVVNEIAIASRVPVPHVYLLCDENAVNAFAVGMEPADTVIGLTAGCIAELNREQLQGVVAHEFAHIANGDTRTNLMLIGYLHGMMVITITATSMINQGIEMMVKSISYGGQGIVGLATLALGVMLWPVGLTGLVCSGIVKAAFNRQREYLADAMGVEFSRNAHGIASAMKRIIGLKEGSRIRSARCMALSHVFFANGSSGVSALLDSHPPIARRVARLDRHWDGEPEYEAEHQVASFGGVMNGTMSIAQGARSADCGRLAETAVESEPLVLDPRLMEVNDHAASVRLAIAPDMWTLTQSLPAAEAMIFALWGMGTSEAKGDDVEIHSLAEHCAKTHQLANALQPHLEKYGLSERLMLFDAAVNVVRRECERGNLEAFCEKAMTLIGPDEETDLFRWSWQNAIRQIVERERGVVAERPCFRDIEEVLDECELILSALAYANASPMMEELALRRAGNFLGHDLSLRSKQECSLPEIDRCLKQVRLLTPKARRRVVLASSTSIESDSVLNEEEALLIRGICSGLGYPPATILPGQPVKLS